VRKAHVNRYRWSFAIAIPIIGADCQHEAACFAYIAFGLDSRR
jgi:hypothetical protein